MCKQTSLETAIFQLIINEDCKSLQQMQIFKIGPNFVLKKILTASMFQVTARPPPWPRPTAARAPGRAESSSSSWPGSMCSQHGNPVTWASAHELWKYFIKSKPNDFSHKHYFNTSKPKTKIISLWIVDKCIIYTRKNFTICFLHTIKAS